MGQSLLYFGSEEQKADWLPQLAAGSVIGVVAFTEGQDMLPRAPRLRLEAGRLSGSKPAVVAGGIADGAVVLALGADGPVLALVDLSQRGVSRTLLDTFHNSRCTADLVFGAVAAHELPGRIDALAAARASFAPPTG